jgi:hypothetical protein
MWFVDFVGLLTALGFFLVWLDMKATARIFAKMRNDISLLNARIVKLERDKNKNI